MIMPGHPDSVFDISMDEFRYELPSVRIAPYPLSERDQSRLLVHRDGKSSSAFFRELPAFMDAGSLMVLNNTRVVQARLLFQKESGARIEVFCLQPVSPASDVNLALGMPSPARWECLVGNAKKWKKGSLLSSGNGLELAARLGDRVGDAWLVEFSWNPPDLAFGEVLEMAGITPLPPYIQRAAEASDKDRYQTVYARDAGSVAAPTAGLHFTPAVFESLAARGVDCRHITLHVGAGTFKPVSGQTIGSHTMHREQFTVPRTLIETMGRGEKKLVSVGTTSMRTLESLYWIGAQLLSGYIPADGKVYLDQWYPYYAGGPLPGKPESMEAILHWMDENAQDNMHGETALIIVPGYPFKMVDALITNFHQPGSTLLLLVAAFAGPSWKDAYRYALENGFRFLSYGDSCLFERLE
jgi:S-adenosylmethionine:tRNA ribosyltransferase-isomerase